MKAIVLVSASLLTVLLDSGCATFVSGSHQDVHVTSDPPGVQVRADNGVTIDTPGDINLVRNKPHTLVATYENAEAQERELRSDLNGWFLGNILLGGLIGMGVDLVSGAYATLSPETVHFDFTEEGQARARRKQQYLRDHPELRKDVKLAILHDRPRTRMTQEQLVLTLGQPDEIAEDGKYERYVYADHDPSQYGLRDGVIEHIRK
jgi:hypothetical protein